MRLVEGTVKFKIAIAIDRLFNVLTGGTFKECFSSRSYLQSKLATDPDVCERWCTAVRVIDKIFWKGHCKDSFTWEMKIKKEYVEKYKHFL